MNRMCRILLLLVVATFVVGIHAQDYLTGPDAEDAVLQGEDHTLTCRRGPDGQTGSIIWDEALDGGGRNTLFVNEGKENSDIKYNNFAIDSGNLYDLVITNIQIEDEGTYFCRHPSSGTEIEAVRTVEVRSTELKMTQDGSDTSNVVVTEGEPSEIVCTARGARPAVEIRWYRKTNGGSESRITAGVGSTEVDNGDGTFDTVGTLNYTASRNYNDGQLRCQTHGQQVAASREHISALNVRFPPDVTLIYGNDRATCTVESANPPVPTPGGFTFIVNNTDSDPYPPTSCEGNVCYLDLKVDFDTNLRCNVTNDVGTATAVYLAEPGATPPPEPTTKPMDTTKKGGDPGPNVGAIAAGVVVGIIVLAVIIALLVYFLVIRKGNKTKNSQGSELKPVNGSGGDSSKPKDRPTPAPRNSKGDAHDNEEGKKKVKPNDNPDGLLYAQLDHSNKPARNSGNGNNIIRTEEPTEYADVKTFISSTSESTSESTL
ncbi:cell adhesion molecule 2-like isoform X2 [Amphiura filiformis]|uniref:cell adhesion molecule 2-like isoform X2 n=1 Tax=Amphiura filiformis TaxID=82378 RepID=UPI003B21B75F